MIEAAPGDALDGAHSYQAMRDWSTESESNAKAPPGTSSHRDEALSTLCLSIFGTPERCPSVWRRRL